MGHPDLIGVGKGEGEAEETVRSVFPDGIDLSSSVATGLFDGEKKLAGIVADGSLIVILFRIPEFR